MTTPDSERRWAAGPWFVRKRPTDDGLAVIEDGREYGLFPILCEWSEADLVAAAPDQNAALENAPPPMTSGLDNEAEWRKRYLDWWHGERKAALSRARGEGTSQ